MNLSEMIIAEAHARGLRHCFGLPGAGCPLDIMEAGRQAGVEFVTVAHESSAAIMAAYYGRMKDTVGLALAIRGPGAGNLVAGALNCLFERMGVVLLCESRPSSFPAGRQAVQVCDQDLLFRAATKFEATLVPGDAPKQVRQAVWRATDGRPGPVLLNLPSDLGRAECGGPLEPLPSLPAQKPDEAHLAAARKAIEASSRPLIIVGADVARTGAQRELVRLAEKIGSAVLVALDARGVYPESHPRWGAVFHGVFAGKPETPYLSKADLVIVVGMDAMMTHALWPLKTPVVEFSARNEYEPLVPSATVRVTGDLAESLRQMGDGPQRSGFSEEDIRAVKAQILPFFARPAGARFAAQDIIEITRRALPPQGVLISETGAYVNMLEQIWPVECYGTYFGTSGGRTMGLTIPALLGAKMATPDLPMAGIGGDGSTLMRLGELEVFARTKVAAPIIVINDRALGTMKSRQKSRRLPAHSLDLQPVDFAAMARACGLRGATVETPEDFEAQLRAALDADRATLIDARVDPQPYQDNFARINDASYGK